MVFYVRWFKKKNEIFLFLQTISKKGLKKVKKPAAGKGLKKTVKDTKLAKKTPKVTARDLKKKAKSK